MSASRETEEDEKVEEKEEPGIQTYLSHCVTKPTICICESKGSDQLCGNREADQRLCFRYRDSTMPLHCKSEIQVSSLLM